MIATSYEDLYTRSEQMEEDTNVMGYKVADNMKWISMVDVLTGGDITKDAAVYELGYIEVLNRLAFWKQRDQTYKKRLTK